MLSAEDYLNSLPRFAEVGAPAYKPGLERMERLLEMLGSPHRRFPSIHVAGTNGKGSTASLIAAVGTSAGLRIGLHTSPHLFRVTERLRVDGRSVTDEWFYEAVDRIRPYADRIEPSYFEATVALAFSYFAERQVDVAVVETGMGGRLDATNVLPGGLAVITQIGLDHMEFLGDSEEAIAAEKAGIIKPESPVVCATGASAAAVIKRIASAQNSAFHDVSTECVLLKQTIDVQGSTFSLRTPVRLYEDLYVDLPGRHQVGNALCAIRAAELAFPAVLNDPAAVHDGLRRVRQLSGLRGRLEILRSGPHIIADVAHNPDGLSAAIEYLLQSNLLKGRLEVLLGVMRDKDAHEMARVLASVQAIVHPVTIDSPRALATAELGRIMSVSGVQVATPCTVRDGVRAFLSGAAPSDTLLVTGSHLVVAQLEGVPL